jgi:hypothetical protein
MSTKQTKKAFKISRRKFKTDKKLEESERFERYFEEFSSISDSDIYKLSIDIINDLNTTSDMEVKTDLEIKLSVLKKIIDVRLYPTIGKEIKNDFNYYPEYKDKDFNKKIYYKKEFLINKTPKKTKKVDLDKLSKLECGNKDFFKLSNSQKFIKTFLSPNTPYNSALLYYGTGVGKTCASISVVEQYMNELHQTNKKIYILLNPSIKANFLKNIFNIERVKTGNFEQQCTGRKYLDLIGYNQNFTVEETNKKINSIINSRYKFMGYQEFANFIEGIENKSYGSISENMKQKIINNKLKSLFSNSIMIIDEAHNIKEGSSGKDKKILPPILERLVKLSDNMKLLLLSATPMFDNASEIRWLINLLLMNDKRPTLQYNELFDTKGNLTESGMNTLIYNTRGYISYLRGENPIKFPLRLYPNIYKHPLSIKHFPNIDVDGNDILEDNMINELNILGCPMEGQQLQDYNTMIESDSKFGSFDQLGLMLSNISFPNPSTDHKIKIGNTGFNYIFSKQKVNNRNIYRFKKPEYNQFLDEKNIKNYSSKLHAILQNVKNKEGIIFIYSQFIGSGVLPLALMLEYNGYTFLNGNKEEILLDSENKKPPIVENGNKLRFIMITGDMSLSRKDSYAEYMKIENQNQNGELVKIIIGSETAAEGLDFSNIREVHILDPWHHMNKTEQIIGRAIRYCSHINLPLEKRNVTVNLYASTLSPNPKNDVETIDLKTYRSAENKSKQMAKVEYLLKKNAVDCNINIEGNQFIGEVWDQNVRVKLPFSKRDVYQNVNISDIDGSKKCNYRECDYKCDPDISDIDITKMNKDTFDDNLIESYIYEISVYIKNLYKEQFIYDLPEIINRIQSVTNLEPILIEEAVYGALELLLTKKKDLYDKFNRKGHLHYEGGYYIFKPNDLRNTSLSYRDLSTPLTIKTRKLNITKITDKLKKSIPKIEGNIDDIIRNLVQLEFDSKNMLLQDKKIPQLKKQSLIKDIDSIYSINIDWLNMSDKETLLQYLISNLESLNEHDTKLLKQLDNCILYFQRDINYGNPDFAGNMEIFGYKILEDELIKYMRYDKKEQKFIRANSLQKRGIQQSILKKQRELDNSIIIGYMEQKMPENTMVLKIRDKTGEGKKGTQIKKGSICGNDGMKKGKIIEYIHKVLTVKEYESGDRKTLPGKYTLCKELEIYLRKNDQINHNKLKWFYNAEEAVEFGITG